MLIFDVVTALACIVPAAVTLPDPSKLALHTTSPDMAIVRAVSSLGAELMVRTGVVVGLATVRSAFAEVTDVTVPEPPEGPSGPTVDPPIWTYRPPEVVHTSPSAGDVGAVPSGRFRLAFAVVAAEVSSVSVAGRTCW